MTANQIWATIGVVILILIIIGLVRGGFVFARRQRIREQQEYKPLRSSQSSVSRGQEDGIQAPKPVILWGNIEPGTTDFINDTDFQNDSDLSPRSRIRWGSDNDSISGVSSALPPITTLHWGEIESIWNSQVDEPDSEEVENSVLPEKWICPICKHEINGSTSDTVICNGNCDTHYHHKCLEDYAGICLICKTKIF